MKLTIEQCLTVQTGLQRLDSRFDKVIDDGRNKKVIQASYDLSKKVRIENGIRLTRLEAPLKAYQDERLKMLEKYGEVIEGEFKVSPKNELTYARENQQALSVEVSIDIPSLAVDELKLDVNDIPGTVLGFLAPILSDNEA